MIIGILVVVVLHFCALYFAYDNGRTKGTNEILRDLQDRTDYLAWFVVEEDFADQKKGDFVQCKGLIAEVYFPRGMKFRPATGREMQKKMFGDEK